MCSSNSVGGILTRKQVTLWVASIWLVSLAASVFIADLNSIQLNFSDWIAYVLGGSLGLLVISGIFPLILWGAHKFNRDDIPKRIRLWAGLIIATSVLVVWSANIRSGTTEQSGYWFRPDDCKHVVYFPAQPQLKTIHSPAGPTLQAELASRETGLLRAECMGNLETRLQGKSEIGAMLYEYAQMNGLQNITLEFPEEDGALIARVRGYKTVSNVPLTYESIFYGESSSIFGITVGGLSSSYPQNAIAEFIGSVSNN